MNDPLSRAAEIVGGSRCETYGKPIDNHSCTAALWSTWLSRKLRTPIMLTATDVCWFNILQKCSREANKHDDDNPVDVCGYAMNDWLCRQEKTARIDRAMDAVTEQFKDSIPDELLEGAAVLQTPAAGSQMPEPPFAPYTGSPIKEDMEHIIASLAAVAGNPMPEPQHVWLEESKDLHKYLPNRVIYVHGPFTNGGAETQSDRNINTRKAIDTGVKLAKKGWLPHIPHAATGCLDHTTDLSYEDYMELDHAMLGACSCGFRVNGPSKGADRENRALLDASKPVWYNISDVPDIRSQLHGAKITDNG